MITRRFKDRDGVVYERWYESYTDVPDQIEIAVIGLPGAVLVAKKIFEAPAFQFVGSFSGGTTLAQIKTEADDGSYIEPGRLKDIDNQKQHLEEQRDKVRHDTLAEEFSKFDESILRDPQVWDKEVY